MLRRSTSKHPAVLTSVQVTPLRRLRRPFACHVVDSSYAVASTRGLLDYPLQCLPSTGDLLGDYGQCHFSWVVHLRSGQRCRLDAPSFQSK